MEEIKETKQQHNKAPPVSRLVIWITHTQYVWKLLIQMHFVT